MEQTLGKAGKGRNSPCRVTLSPQAQAQPRREEQQLRSRARIWDEITGDITELQNIPSWE